LSIGLGDFWRITRSLWLDDLASPPAL